MQVSLAEDMATLRLRDSKTSTCSRCGRKVDASNFRRHLKSQLCFRLGLKVTTPSYWKRRAPCPLCKQPDVLVHNLRRHQKSHRCQVAAKSFQTSSTSAGGTVLSSKSSSSSR